MHFHYVMTIYKMKIIKHYIPKYEWFYNSLNLIFLF